MNRDVDFDYLDLDDDSDNENPESSDDEIDILLHGTPEQKRKMCRRSSSVTKESSSEDEFEKEMNEELNGKVKVLEMERRRGSFSEPGCSSSSTTEATEPQKYYDDVYFDSDEEDMVTQGDAKKEKKQKQLSNDELLYDPDIDEDNERWVEQQRRSYQPHQPEGSKQKRLPNSDAVLDCPACMTTLCLDCQRHDVYDNQYRAMFVTNCKTDTSELLKYPKASKRSRKRKKNNQEGGTDEDKFHPVRCEECNTVVAVIDDDEVYHFFNVLASY